MFAGIPAFDEAVDLGRRYRCWWSSALWTTTAATMRQILRHADIVGRVGGDEFVLLLPFTSSADVQQTMHRLQQELRSAVDLRLTRHLQYRGSHLLKPARRC